MLGVVPASNLQDDGVNLDSVNIFGAVAEGTGNVVAGALPENENALRVWNDPVDKFVVRHNEAVGFSLRVAVQEFRRKIGEPLVPNMICHLGVGRRVLRARLK